jgi:hypothetical protein
MDLSSAYDSAAAHTPTHPVSVAVPPMLTGRNRLTCAFRPFLALPHILFVGGPAVVAVSCVWQSSGRPDAQWSLGTGVLGAVASVVALIAWFSIVITGFMPSGLWNLSAYYLRWRVRAVAYLALLRDEYPPFGDEPYPAELLLAAPDAPRNRLSVAFRLILALPHLVVLWALGIVWAVVTLIIWVSILIDGSCPPSLYRFSLGALRWSTRVEAYVLLLHDEYPPFAFDNT